MFFQSMCGFTLVEPKIFTFRVTSLGVTVCMSLLPCGGWLIVQGTPLKLGLKRQEPPTNLLRTGEHFRSRL